MWKFAENLAKATEVFGLQREAEQWMKRPATGLEQRRPIELLETPAGLELAESFLERLEYGVYSCLPAALGDSELAAPWVLTLPAAMMISGMLFWLFSTLS